MLKILHRYTLKEIIAPSTLAGSALMFIILVAARAPWEDTERLLFTLIKLFFRQGVPKGEVLMVFLLGLPTVALFILPMCLIIGIIIGVGRMTLDLEVRAMQTGGINLLSIFGPVFLMGALLSAATGFFSYSLEPRMIGSSIKRGGKLLVSEFANLEPGRVYGRLFAGRSGLDLYFDARDKETGTIQGVALMVERKAVESDQKREEERAKQKGRMKAVEDRYKSGKISREERDKIEHQFDLQKNAQLPMMIFAREATLGLDAEDLALNLDLRDGSMHMLNAPPDAEDAATSSSLAAAGKKEEGKKEGGKKKGDEQDYALVRFKRMVKSEDIAPPDTRKSRITMTIPELLRCCGDKTQKPKKRNECWATVLERASKSLQCLVFAFIGLPLAIWIRPTGKSVGILLAGAVIFTFYFLMRTGFNMIEAERPLGAIVIFSPNALFAVFGAFLWRRTLRS